MRSPARQAAAIALVFGAMAAAMVQARAQEFWHGTSRGMTVSQVLTAVPGARRPVYPSSLGSGAVELLMRPGVRVQGESFTAHFYFERGDLQEVILLLDGKRRYARLRPVYDALERALTARYGFPAASRERNGGVLQSTSESWHSGQTEIGLAMLRGGDSANLNIYYRMQ